MKNKSKEQEYLEGWQRCKADFLNYKKEIDKQKDVWRKNANEDLILKILPILDGMEMLVKEFKRLLNIKKAPIKKFNPEIHEAVAGNGEGIDKVLQNGYYLNGKLIRPAKVKLSNK